MTSGLSFGNYTLLRRLAAGEEITMPSHIDSRLVAEGMAICEGGKLRLTENGRKELRKDAPQFPALGRSAVEATCSRCGEPFNLCVGELR